MSQDDVTFAESNNEFDLWHYASKYYDPVKAKEYYERTKQLKGRETGTVEKLSAESRQRQTEATAYVRNQVTTQRTAAQKATAEAQTARLKKLQADAKASRERIVTKLTALVESLKANIAVEVPKPELNKIPPTASARQRTFLEKQNERMISEYNGKLRRATDKARKSQKEAVTAAREEIKKVGTSLRSAVEKARKEYAASRKSIAEKYSSDLKTELKNVRDKVR